jgi:SecD/SecF fusion protein
MFENLGRKITLISILLAISLGLLLLKDQPFNLGLDLQGGTRLVYSVDFEAAIADGRISRNEDQGQVLGQMITIIRNRVDPDGLLEPVIRSGGGNRIIIELPGTLGLPSVQADSILREEFTLGDDVIKLADASNFPDSGVVKFGEAEQVRYGDKSGNDLLELKLVTGTPRTHNADVAIALVKDDAFRASIESLGNLSFQIVAEAALLLEKGTDLSSELEKRDVWAAANPDLPITNFNRVPEEDGGPHASIAWYPTMPQSDAQEAADYSEAQFATPVLRPGTPDDDFRGNDLARANYSQDSSGFPAVAFEMRSGRRSDFSQFTADNINNQMAIILNEEVASAPRIEGRLPGGGIIRGRFTEQEVKDLVTILRSGSLKIRPTLESDERVGATLGADYVTKGFYSGIIALVAVLGFMVVYYRRLGVYAAMSLVFSFLCLMGGLSFLNATLTLPGIAGLILTIGMAVDANILIFDRIREEMDKGRNVKQAAKNGFELARSAILDANITTFLTALILYKFGTGPVRGFAVTLMVGILAAVFAALIVTRVFVHLALVRGAKGFSVGTWMVKANYKFLEKAKPALIVSSVFVVLGLGLFIITPNDEKLGIDFLGGVETQLRTAKAEQVDTIREKLSSIEGAIGESAEVKPILASEENGGYTLFRATFKAAEGVGQDSDVKAILSSSLEGLLLHNPIEIGVTGGEAEVTLYFEEPHATSDIASALTAIGLQAVQVTESERSGVYAGTATAGTLTEGQIAADIAREFAKGPDSAGSKYNFAEPLPAYTQVGPQVVGELINSALLALGISLFVVVMYIRVRFAEYSYGFAALVALLHDVAITLGALTLANRMGFLNGEINLPMIAAGLTIIGYSLNDTIVIFDRVRENLPRMKASLWDVLNTSINQTLSRTILTSFTTFLAVGILYVVNFGTGNVLETFSFAMMIGILTGTYSTIFIANPTLWWLERKSGRLEREARSKQERDKAKQAAKGDPDELAAAQV